MYQRRKDGRYSPVKARFVVRGEEGTGHKRARARAADSDRRSDFSVLLM